MSIDTWDVPFEAYTGDNPYIFVSYSHTDKTHVYPDITSLHKAGFRIWYDEGIDPGFEWAAEVAKALNQCSLFIVFISNNSVNSRNVRNEINYALNHNKKFLAIHITPTDLPPALELRIGDIQAILCHQMNRDMYLKKLQLSLSTASDKTLISILPLPGDNGKVQGTIPRQELDQVIRRISALYRKGEYEKIRLIGSDVAASLIANANDSLSDCQALSDLGIHLTDANAHIWARRCFDAAIGKLLESESKGLFSLGVHNQLGMVYNNTARLLRMNNSVSRRAESFYRKSLEIFRGLYPDVSDDPDLGDRLGMTFTNLGNTMAAQEKNEAAMSLYLEGIKTYERILMDYPNNERLKQRHQHAKDDFFRAASS